VIIKHNSGPRRKQICGAFLFLERMSDMNHRKACLTAALLAALAITAAPTVCAEESPQPEVSVIDITEGAPPEVAGKYLPAKIWTEEEDGFHLLKKRFVVDAGVSPWELMEGSITRRGISYQYLEMVKEELPGSTETKTASRKETIATGSKDQNTIAAQAEQTVSYEQDGFKGELTLDSSGIVAEESGRQSYSYGINDTRTYTGLASNDPYLVPKEVNKNGITLSLQDIQWTPAGVKLDGSGLPASYTATASYSGKGWGSKAAGYTATLPYSGEVTREIPGKVQYTLVYEEILPEPVEEKDTVSPLLVSGGIALAAAAGLAGWNLQALKRRKEAPFK